jgi:hypothetical protein
LACQSILRGEGNGEYQGKDGGKTRGSHSRKDGTRYPTFQAIVF